MQISFESLKKEILSPLPVKKTDSSIPGFYAMDDATALGKNRVDAASALVFKNILFYLGLIFRYPTEQIYSEIESRLDTFTDFFVDYGGAAPQLPPIDELQSEYIRLFVNNQGFVPAMPYASCYQSEGLLMSDQFYRLRQIMAKSGFMMNETVKELEDHIAVLLEFCAGLLNQLASGQASSGKSSGACVAALMEVSYLYIEPMMDAFCDRIHAYAHDDFYKIAGKTLKSLMQDADTIYDQLLGFRIHSINELQG